MTTFLGHMYTRQIHATVYADDNKRKLKNEEKVTASSVKTC